MRKIAITFILSLISVISLQAQVGINIQTPDASAALHIESTTQGVLIPRMTTAKKNAISAPATGLIVYDTDLRCISQNVGTPTQKNWVCLIDKDPRNAFFYMPTIDIPATEAGTEVTLDLYAEYRQQFENVPTTQRSVGSRASIPFFTTATQLNYYITDYDSSVIKINSLSGSGVLKYQIRKEANYSSYMTILFVVR